MYIYIHVKMTLRTSRFLFSVYSVHLIKRPKYNTLNMFSKCHRIFILQYILHCVQWIKFEVVVTMYVQHSCCVYMVHWLCIHSVGLNKTRSRTMTFLSSTLALSPHLEFLPAGFFLLSRSSVFDQAYCFVCCFQSHGHINFRLQLLRSCNSQRPTANIWHHHRRRQH